ncbi:Ribokinase-like protein [Abortiporus biennis]|nr:Ribokinase-like protein [Abortiporus biennis]
MSKGRVLSIQSHVAFGYVGGKAAVFPLQCLGYDVDVVNTVNFSNHSGYGRFGGSKANASELSTIFSTMEQNGLLRPERLLTGYIPSGDALLAIKDLAVKLRERNPDLLYLLDPVLGDAGKLYVSPDVIPVYQSMLPLATIITPNWFEVEVLTGVHMTDLRTLRQALKILHHEHKVPNVVISSIPLKEWLKSVLPSDIYTPSPLLEAIVEQDYLLCITSSSEDLTPTSSPPSRVHARAVPCIPGYFSGVGDLFSALVLAHFKPSVLPTISNEANCAESNAELEDALAHAVSHAITKTHAMLTLTQSYAMTLPEDERQPTDDELDENELDRKVRRMKGRELRLIQGQDIIRGLANVENRKMDRWVGFWDDS